MAEAGWNKPTSPFHVAAQRIQERLGVRDQIEKFGRRGIRDYMTDEVRTFVDKLPFVIVGALDAHRHPWATVLAGPPGFVVASDLRVLVVRSTFAQGGPVSGTVGPGSRISLLGIELPTRRRNTINGRVAAVGDGCLAVHVEQCFGNCPQYIQQRVRIDGAVAATEGAPVRSRTILDDSDRRLIAGADTFFVATCHPSDDGNPAHGMDVSHRGGRPGFVSIADDRTLVWPEFQGNSQYNTLGNIAANPQAGLLFIDFDTGAGLHLTGRAEIVWEDREIARLRGSRQLVRFYVVESIRVAGLLHDRWRFESFSPRLEGTGTWDEPAHAGAADAPEPVPTAAPPADAVEVVFAKSGIAAAWNPADGSILDLAEDSGLRPDYGCRSAMCGACAVKIVEGEIEYEREILAAPEHGTALICKALVKPGPDGRRRIVLDL